MLLMHLAPMTDTLQNPQISKNSATMTTVEVAEYLNMTRQNVSLLEKNGTFHPITIGNRGDRLFNRGEVESYAAMREKDEQENRGKSAAVMKIKQTMPMLDRGGGMMTTTMQAQTEIQTALTSATTTTAQALRHLELVMDRSLQGQSKYEDGQSKMMEKVLKMSQSAFDRLEAAEKRADHLYALHLKNLEAAEELLSLKQSRELSAELSAERERAKLEMTKDVVAKLTKIGELVAPGVLAKIGLAASPRTSSVSGTGAPADNGNGQGAMIVSNGAMPDGLKGARALQWFVANSLSVGKFSQLRNAIGESACALLDKLLAASGEDEATMKEFVAALIGEPERFGELGKILDEEQVASLLALASAYMG